MLLKNIKIHKIECTSICFCDLCDNTHNTLHTKIFYTVKKKITYEKDELLQAMDNLLSLSIIYFTIK